MSARKPFIVGIGGTTRPGSSSEQALAMALAFAAAQGAETKLYGGKELQLPMYDPDPAGLTEAARGFIEDLRRADGVIISSPCYHGGVSGLVKNAIDYTEEMRADARVYFDGRAVGAIGCGYGYQGPGMVLSQLRQIGHALRGWNVPLGVAVNSAVVKFSNGECSEPAIAKQIEIDRPVNAAAVSMTLPALVAATNAGVSRSSELIGRIFGG
jgi:FMN reductase